MDDLSSRVLRVHDEPFAYVDEGTVHLALSAEPAKYVLFVEKRLRELAAHPEALEQPPKLIFSDRSGGGDFRVMPCVTWADGSVVKTVKLVGTNKAQVEVPDQVTVGRALRLHPDENFVTHVFEACLLSSARTGVCAAVACRQLARKQRLVSVVGAGRVGYYAALFTAAVADVRQVVFHDLEVERAEAAAELLRRALGGRVACCAAPVGRGAESDTLILATTATRPVCGPDDVAASLVVSLGADTEDQRELESSWASSAHVYVDSLDSERVGDLRAWLAAKLIERDQVTALSQLVGGEGHPPPGARSAFISTGSALLDNLTIEYLMTRCHCDTSPVRSPWPADAQVEPSRAP